MIRYHPSSYHLGFLHLFTYLSLTFFQFVLFLMMSIWWLLFPSLPIVLSFRVLHYPTIFLLFVNDLNCSFKPIHSYVDNSTLILILISNMLPLFNQSCLSSWVFDFIAAHLNIISQWSRLNLVNHSLKIKLLQISISKTLSKIPISFDGSPASLFDNVNIFALNISKECFGNFILQQLLVIFSTFIILYPPSNRTLPMSCGENCKKKKV